MGMKERQILTGLEIPVALPVIATGIRLAAVQVVATATLGSIFGFGGLGRYIVIGEDTQNTGEEFGGVVLVAALALVTFGLFTLIERRLISPGLRAGTGD
jgi:osmoprotectant transport system permease protein